MRARRCFRHHARRTTVRYPGNYCWEPGIWTSVTCTSTTWWSSASLSSADVLPTSHWDSCGLTGLRLARRHYHIGRSITGVLPFRRFSICRIPNHLGLTVKVTVMVRVSIRVWVWSRTMVSAIWNSGRIRRIEILRNGKEPYHNTGIIVL